MTKFDFISQDLEVIGSESGKISYEKGSHYIATSFDGDGTGAISIYDESIMGIIGFKNGDNFNIGELKNSSGKYIIYRDADLKRDLKIYCDTQEEPLTEDDIKDLKNFSRNEEDKCIDIYIEADYALYSENGKNITKTINYILGLFAETALIYRNEGISIKVSRIKIWETPDSYNTNSSHKALGEFGENNPDSDTDLNLLMALGGKGLGGVAWLNALCNEGIHFAYANIDSIYNNVPTYSWSVMVITHELGHNLGSVMTHGCNWFDTNTQIDDCGNVYFYNNGNTPEGVSCFDPEIL